MYSVVLNSSNITNLNSGNNRFRCTFPTAQKFENKCIAITQLSLYYAWNNITSVFNNNKFGFIFPNGTGYSNYEVNLPDSNLEYADLNTALQLYCKSQGLYLLDSSGKELYFLSIQLFQAEYSVILAYSPVPTSLPSGYSKPSNCSINFPDVTKTPQFVIYDNNFTTILGIPSGTYPSIPQTTGGFTKSSTTPQISPIQCLLFQCNLCYNPYSEMPSFIFATTNNNATYGSIIPSPISFPQYSDIKDGFYSSMEISIVDQDFNAVTILDPDILILLTIAPQDRI